MKSVVRLHGHAMDNEQFLRVEGFRFCGPAV
jgi:hypothetical protein